MTTPPIPFYNIVVFTGTATLNIEKHRKEFRKERKGIHEFIVNSEEYPVAILKLNQLHNIDNMICNHPKNLTDSVRQLIKDAITENLSLTMPDKSEMIKEEKLTHFGEGIEEFKRKESKLIFAYKPAFRFIIA